MVRVPVNRDSVGVERQFGASCDFAEVEPAAVLVKTPLVQPVTDGVTRRRTTELLLRVIPHIIEGGLKDISKQLMHSNT